MKKNTKGNVMKSYSLKPKTISRIRRHATESSMDDGPFLDRLINEVLDKREGK